MKKHKRISKKRKKELEARQRMRYVLLLLVFVSIMLVVATQMMGPESSTSMERSDLAKCLDSCWSQDGCTEKCLSKFPNSELIITS